MSKRGLTYKSIDQFTVATASPATADHQIYFDDAAGEWKKHAPAGSVFALNVTDAITYAEHGNRILYCTTAATLTWTLPAPTGTGNYYHFLMGIITTGDKVIKCASTTAHALIGGIMNSDGDTLFLPAGFTPATTSDVITLNKTTTGGLLGDWVKVTDVALNVWYVEGQIHTTAGTNPATPFSST